MLEKKTGSAFLRKGAATEMKSKLDTQAEGGLL